LYKIIYSAIFLPLIFFIGIITTREDIKSSKIKNKWVLLGLLYSFIVYLLSWIVFKLALAGIVNPFIGQATSYLIWNFDKWCINLMISSLVAYFLWHFKMWAAGDAKLFICYTALIPINQYSKVYFGYYFASFLLLLTIFIPATIFIFLRSVIYFIKRFELSKLRERMPKLIKEKLAKFNGIEVGKIILGFFVFFLFFKILREGLTNLVIKFLPKQNILLLASLLAFKQLSKFFKKNTKLMLVALVILIAYIGFKVMYSREQFILGIGNILGSILSIMILFPVFKKIINIYTEKTTQKTIPFAIWMFLGALIVWFI